MPWFTLRASAVPVHPSQPTSLLGHPGGLTAYGVGTFSHVGGVMSVRHLCISPVAVFMRHAKSALPTDTCICHGPVRCAPAYETPTLMRIAAAITAAAIMTAATMVPLMVLPSRLGCAAEQLRYPIVAISPRSLTAAPDRRSVGIALKTLA